MKADLTPGVVALAQAIAQVIVEAVEIATARPPSNVPLTSVVAAKFLGVHRTEIVRMAKRGEIPSIGVGRSRRFLPADLETYRRRHRNRIVRTTEDVATAASARPS